MLNAGDPQHAGQLEVFAVCDALSSLLDVVQCFQPPANHTLQTAGNDQSATRNTDLLRPLEDNALGVLDSPGRGEVALGVLDSPGRGEVALGVLARPGRDTQLGVLEWPRDEAATE